MMYIGKWWWRSVAVLQRISPPPVSFFPRRAGESISGSNDTIPTVVSNVGTLQPAKRVNFLLGRCFTHA